MEFSMDVCFLPFHPETCHQFRPDARRRRERRARLRVRCGFARKKIPRQSIPFAFAARRRCSNKERIRIQEGRHSLDYFVRQPDI